MVTMCPVLCAWGWSERAPRPNPCSLHQSAMLAKLSSILPSMGSLPHPAAQAELGLLHSLTVSSEHQLYVRRCARAGHVKSDVTASGYEETSRGDRVKATATVECEKGQKYRGVVCCGGTGGANTECPTQDQCSTNRSWRTFHTPGCNNQEINLI